MVADTMTAGAMVRSPKALTGLKGNSKELCQVKNGMPRPLCLLSLRAKPRMESQALVFVEGELLV